MSLSTLKRKIDNENRQFKSEWTENYLFVPVGAKPMCLLCNESISVTKEYNLRRHYKAMHPTFETTFPSGSNARRGKIRSLTLCYEQSKASMSRLCTEQEKATLASFRVAWILTKKKRPFTDAETVKECMLAAIEEIVADPKIRTSVTESIKKIPVSDTSTIRRIESLATDVFETLLDKLKNAEVMSLAVEESTNNSDVSQLCLYVRFFDGGCFREDLLGLIPLEGRTTGEIIWQKIAEFFEENGLDLRRVNMLLTDGGPAMTGKVQGLSTRVTAIVPQMRSLHCLIHQCVLCAKLSGDLKNTMESAVAIINFFRSTSSLQHRLFQKLLSDMSAEHNDLLIHNEVHWLSKGNALKLFCELKEEIVTFLSKSNQKKAENFLAIMQNEKFVAKACF